MNIEILKTKEIAILGYGREGKSTLRFLKNIGARDITILDKNIETIENIEDEDIICIWWNSYLDSLSDFDIIFKSPGVCPYNDELAPYKEKFISQTQIFYETYPGKVIAVTGTKGKSTTSTLIYLSLKEAGYNVKLVGNIWNPVFDEIDIIPFINKSLSSTWLGKKLGEVSEEIYDFIIYEMSSYMLEGFIPKTYISVFNNIYNCHLDWHRGFENYKNAKLNILRNSEYALINFEFKDFDEVKTISSNTQFFWIDGDFSYKNNWFYIADERVLEDENIVLLWEHNRKNIAWVLGVIYRATGKDIEKTIWALKKVISTFEWLPHRMEKVGTFKGITFINDAIATTPESTLAAIKTFSPDIGTLFLGGYDSGFIYTELEKNIELGNIENLVLFPDTGYKIFTQDIENKSEEIPFQIQKNGRIINILKTRSMETAVKFAYEYTQEGKIALLSNASQSFSLWKSYEVKGNLFKELVIKYSSL